MITLEFDRPETRGFGAEIMAELRPQVVAFVERASIDLLARLKRAIGRAGAGRRYRRGKGRWHRASLPGQPPARDSGRYVNSWQHAVVSDEEFVSGGVYSPMWGKEGARRLGMWLEYGTRRMRPRPHLGPVMEEWSRDLNQRMGR